MKLTPFLVLAGLAGQALYAAPRVRGPLSEGSLISFRNDGVQLECPLRHTDVKAEVSGYAARVNVTQEFENKASDKIDAVYVFPLPHNAAVDRMTMTIGTRTIRSEIKRREEAQALYDAARQSGRTAALLDQERPNIFTQQVANIPPGGKVRVEISYVETVPFSEGKFEFVFPMVVGPRYVPGMPIGGGDTDRVPDGSRISPPVTPEGTRAGHDLSLEVKLDSGGALGDVVCATHQCNVDKAAPGRAVVRLQDRATIPNKDFVLRYALAGAKMPDAVLTHAGSRGNFFSIVLQPPQRVSTAEIMPKELVFVLDTSGSMSGFPIEKAKETIRLALSGLHSTDTFNLITFAGDTSVLFPAPVPATYENLEAAKRFLAGKQGRGGTEMMKAIVTALAPSDSQAHMRIVCFLTDGFVGNEDEIISEVRLHPQARVFSFGIGTSVNRYLLDKMAEAGRGEVEYVGPQDDGSAAAKRFYERVRDPLLTDITIEWNGLPVADVYPARLPDLFSAKPLVVTGRYTAAASGTLRIRGKLAGAPFERTVTMNLPAAAPSHDVLAMLWARAKVDHLTHVPAAQSREEITRLGLKFGLLTQYTSFIAVDESRSVEGGPARRVEVPVEMPAGVSYEAVAGLSRAKMAAPYTPGFLPSTREVKVQAPQPLQGSGKVAPGLAGLGSSGVGGQRASGCAGVCLTDGRRYDCSAKGFGV